MTEGWLAAFGVTPPLPQPQTDARVADLLFKLDVAATTFEKVTTSEHREAVFNAEHAKLLRDTIKVLRQPQTDALKVAALVEASEGLKQDLLNRAEWDDDAKAVCAGAGAWFRFTEALAALKESK